MSTDRKLRLAVLGTPEHEGRMTGRAFEILGIEPEYLDPARPVFSEDAPPDVILVSREWSIALREAVLAGRRKGIPVVYLMDGVLEWTYLWDNWSYVKAEGTVLQPLLASHLCVIGRHPARLLAAIGLADRIRVVGLPRLDGAKRERILRKDVGPRIMVATARTWGLNVAHKVYMAEAIRDLRDWFVAHSSITPVWRIAAELAQDIGVEPNNEGPILDALKVCDGLISATSTVLLEGMLVGVPTSRLDYRPLPQLVGTAWEIRSRDHIESVAQELLHPPGEKLAFQESCLRDELEFGDASARLAETIKQAVDEPAPSGATSDSMELDGEGALDFRRVHSHLSSFSITGEARLQYELEGLYKLREEERRQFDFQREQLQNGLEAERHILRVMASGRLAKTVRRLRWLPGFQQMAGLFDRLDRMGSEGGAA